MEALDCEITDFVARGVQCQYEVSSQHWRTNDVMEFFETQKPVLGTDFLKTEQTRIFETIRQDKEAHKATKSKATVPRDFYTAYISKEKKSQKLLAFALVRRFSVRELREKEIAGFFVRKLSDKRNCMKFPQTRGSPWPLRRREMFLATGTNFAAWCFLIFHILQNSIRTDNPIWLRLDTVRSRQRQCAMLDVLQKRFGGYPFYFQSEDQTGHRPIHWQFPTSAVAINKRFRDFDTLMLKRAQAGKYEFDEDDLHVLS